MKYFQKFATFATAATMLAAGLTQVAYALDPAASTDTGYIAPGNLGLSDIQTAAGFGSKTIYQTAGSLIQVILTLTGLIAIVLVIYGGFKWMTSGGEESKVDDAKKILYSGIIGLALILSAYALTTFVVSTLFNATGATGFSGSTGLAP